MSLEPERLKQIIASILFELSGYAILISIDGRIAVAYAFLMSAHLLHKHR